MRRLGSLSAVVLVAAMLLGACGSSSKKTAATNTTSASTTMVQESTTAASTTGGAALSVVTNAGLGKQILVDSAGMTVYLYMPDGASKTSTVPSSIQANWPPVKAAAGTPTVGMGLDASKLTVDMQANGTSQLAYNGHLLYNFAGDSAPGDAKGNAVGGIWFALSPSGDKLS